MKKFERRNGHRIRHRAASAGVALGLAAAFVITSLNVVPPMSAEAQSADADAGSRTSGSSAGQKSTVNGQSAPNKDANGNGTDSSGQQNAADAAADGSQSRSSASGNQNSAATDGNQGQNSTSDSQNTAADSDSSKSSQSKASKSQASSGKQSATIGDTTIQVSYSRKAGLPDGTKLVVNEVADKDEPQYEAAAQEALQKAEGQDGQKTEIVAQQYYDIHFAYDGEEIEPRADVNVRMTLSGDDQLENGDDVQVVHFPDQADADGKLTAEVIDAKVETVMDEAGSDEDDSQSTSDNSQQSAQSSDRQTAAKTSVITFKADSFSVYGITDSDTTNPTTQSTKFVFHYEDNTTDVQYVKDKEALADPGTPSGSQVAKEHQQDVEFLGWYQKNGNTWGAKQSFGTPIAAYVGRPTIDLYPRYEKRAYIYYYDEDKEDVYAITKAEPGDTVYTTDPGTNASGDNPPFMDYMSSASDRAFVGWSENKDATTPDANIRIGENQTAIHLYPVVQQAKWLTFMSGPEDSNATYFASEPILNGTWTRTALDDKVPTRDGYSFDGWYVRNESTQGNDANLNYSWTIASGDVQVTDAAGNLTPGFTSNTAYFAKGNLTRDLTLVAHWSPATVNYTVNYWIQNPDDDGYSYAGSAIRTGVTGTQTQYTPNPEDIGTSVDAFVAANRPYFRQHTGSDQYAFKQATIKPDGSTRLNVYYDRKVYTLRFYYGFSTGSGRNTQYYVNTNTNGYSNAAPSSSLAQALQASSGNTQQVTALPTLSNQNTKTGTTTVGNSTYYYLEIQARYGQDISDLWPDQPFTNDGQVTQSNNSRTTIAFVSWATRNGSGYYKNNTNKNIKGLYSILDQNLIIDPDATDGIAQNFLAYWNNAPEYTYEIYYSLLSGEKADITYNGVGYKLQERYPVRSSDNYRGQNALTFRGVTAVTNQAIGHSGQDANGKGGTVQFAYKRNLHNISFYTTTNTGSSARVALDGSIPYDEDISQEAVVDRHEQEAIDNAPVGYRFTGWYESVATAEDLHRNDLEPEDRQRLEATRFQFSGTMPDHDIVLYAAYEPIDYLVSLDFNGGVPDEGQTTFFWVQYGNKIQENDHVTRNYRRASANDSATAQRYEYIQYKYQPVENGEGYSYYIDDNGMRHNESNTENRYATYRESSTGKYIQQDGAYNFVGWYETDANGRRLSQVSYDFRNNVTHDTYLKARWKNPGVFKVHYLEDDQTDSIQGNAATKPEDETYTYTDLSQAIAAHAMEPADSDYVFDGWRVVGDPDKTTYQPGEVVPIESEYARRESDGTQYIDLEPAFRKKGTTSITYNINLPAGAHASSDKLTNPNGIANNTQSNLPLNSKVTLSDGSGFKLQENNFVLTGWSNKPSVTEEGAIQYKLGGTYGVSNVTGQGQSTNAAGQSANAAGQSSNATDQDTNATGQGMNTVSTGQGVNGTGNTLYAVWGLRFDLREIAQGKPDTPLNGGTFKLTKSGSDSSTDVTALDFYDAVNVPAEGYTATIGGDGQVRVPALKPGQYTLTETKAPDGYDLTPAFSFTVNGNGSITFAGAKNVTYDTTADSATGSTPFTFVIEKVPGVNLPQTGGRGTWRFIVTGLALLIAAGMIFECRKIRRKTY